MRHTFNLSALYAIPGDGRADRRLVVRRHRQRAQRAADRGADRAQRHRLRGRRRATRSSTRRPTAPRWSTRRAAGLAQRRAVPISCRASSPYIKDGGLLFLNPAAFATPKPGTNGNLERNSIHGPNFWQIDAVVAKRVGPSERTQRRTAAGDLQHLQPHQLRRHRRHAAQRLARQRPDRAQQGPAGPALHGGRGRHVRAGTCTVGTTVGIGTNRQIQLAFRFNF